MLSARRLGAAAASGHRPNALAVAVGRGSAGLRAAATTTHFYGALDSQLRNSAGARPRAVDVPYVDQIRAEHLLKLRFHIGHHKRKLDRNVSGHVYGIRHNIAVYDVAKSWRSLRTVFYAFAEMAHLRSSFFLLAPKSSPRMRKLIERMRREYPFHYNRFSSLYMLGYSDHKWIDGTFSNWKQTYAFYEHVQRVLKTRPSLTRFRRLQKYLRGIDKVDLMGRIVPDFMLVFSGDRGAQHEAANLDLPLFGMVDTDTSPLPFLYPVFGNDDSVESVSFLMDLLARAVEEGRKREHEAFAMVMVAKLKGMLAAEDVGRADDGREDAAGGASDAPGGGRWGPGVDRDLADDGDGDDGEAQLEALAQAEADLAAMPAFAQDALLGRAADEAHMRRQPGSREGRLPTVHDVATGPHAV